MRLAGAGGLAPSGLLWSRASHYAAGRLAIAQAAAQSWAATSPGMKASALAAHAARWSAFAGLGNARLGFSRATCSWPPAVVGSGRAAWRPFIAFPARKALYERKGFPERRRTPVTGGDVGPRRARTLAWGLSCVVVARAVVRSEHAGSVLLTAAGTTIPAP